MSKQEKKKSKLKFAPRYTLEEISAKGSIKNAAIKSAAQLVYGVAAGTVMTAVVGGKIGFLSGLGLMGIGNYADIPWMAPMGASMASSSLTMAIESELKGVEGFDFKEEVNKAKDRLSTLKNSFLQKTYLDKVFKGKADDKKGKQTSQRGLREGEERPEEVNGLSDTPHDAAQELDKIEQQLITAAMEHQKKQQSEKQMTGVDPEMFGLEEEVDFSKL